MSLGEDNTRFHTDLYPCTFSKLIEYWRSIWHQRTNSSTDPKFPFGFVQVTLFLFITSFSIVFYSVVNKRSKRYGYWRISHDSLASNI